MKTLHRSLTFSISHRLCLALSMCLLLAKLSYAQSTVSSHHPSQFMVLESNMGTAMRNQQQADIIAGFGIWNYIHINDLECAKKGALGVSIPMRFEMTSPEESVLSDYDQSLSMAALFRIDIQLFPKKETFWWFMGAGPELRTIWSGETSRTLPGFQQEVGIKIRRPNSGVLNSEIGAFVTWPVTKKEWDENLYYASFFARIGIF
jgi:hypothetical protein